MADDRPSISGQLTNPLLVVILGVIFARSLDKPILPERPAGAEEGAKQTLGTSNDALLTHDPFAALLNGKPGETPVHGLELLAPAAPEKTMVLACLLRGGPWPEDLERRIQTRTAVVRGIMDAGFVADDSRSLQLVRADDWMLPYDAFSWPGDNGPFEHIFTLWVDELALGAQPFSRFARLVDDLNLKDRCTLEVLGPTSSGELERWIEDAAVSEAEGRYCLYSPFSTVGELRAERKEPGAEKLVIKPRIGTDDELAKLLVMELRERIPALMSFGKGGREKDAPFTWFHGVPGKAAAVLERIGFIPSRRNARVVLLCESDSLYGRKWTQNLITAWQNEVSSQKQAKPGHIDFESYPYIAVVDGVGLKHAGGEPSDRLVTQIDYIERLAVALEEGPTVDAIGILGSDTHDILQLLGTLRSRFPSAVFFTTDMNTKFLAPEHLPYTRNLVVASHGALVVKREGSEDKRSSAVRPGPVHFRDAYQVSVYRTTSELAQNLRQHDWIPEPPRLYEIGEGCAVDLNLPGSGLEDPVDPQAVYLARLAQRVPWLDRGILRRLVYVACGGLFLWILVQGFRLFSADWRRWLRSAWKPLSLLALAGLSLGGVWAGSGGAEPAELEIALIFAFLLAVAFLLPRRGIAVLLVLLLFLLTRPDVGTSVEDWSGGGAVLPPLLAVFFVSGLFLAVARHPARRLEPLASSRLFVRLRIGLIVAVLAVLFLRSVMGLVAAARISASEPVEFFVGVSVWPTVLLRLIGVAACMFGIAHIRSRLIHEHEVVARRLRGNAAKLVELPRSMPWTWIFDLPTKKDRDGHELAVVWDGLAHGLKSWPWLIARLGLYVAVYFGIMAPLYRRFPIPAPVRGELSYVCERISIFLLVVTFLALFFHVLESSFLALRIAARLRNESTRLPRALIEVEGLGQDSLSGKIVRLELIERIARRCDRNVLWPVAVAALMVLSRSSVFDRWCWPISLVLTFALFFSLLILCALNSQRVAGGELRSVQKALALMPPAPDDDESRRGRLKERLDSLRSGAFQPFYRHPLLRSLGLPIAALMLTKALERGWIPL